jgi:autotransporter-associated beta strand protein
MTSNGGGISVVDPNNILALASQNLSGSGPLTKAGQGVLQLGGSIGSTAITVQDGSLQLTAGTSQLIGNPSLSLWNVATFSFSNHNESVSTINLTGGTINTGTGTLNLAGSLDYARSIWPATIQGNLSLGTSAGTFCVNQGSATDLTIAANISGSPAGGLVKSGNGLLTLCGSNSYSGGTTVSSGTLQVGNGNSNVSLGSGPVFVNANSMLNFDLGNTLAIANPITSGGEVSLVGAGTVVFTASNTYSGGTAITSGTLQIGNGGASGSLGASAVIDNGTLDFSRSDVYTLPVAINGSGALVQIGPGTVVLNASNSYTGGTTISGGTLQVGNGGSGASIGSTSGVTLSNNSAIVFDHSDKVTFTSSITGSGSLTQTGSGKLILTAGNTYDGTTNISGGTLQIGNGGTLGAGAVVDNSVLLFSHSNLMTIANAISGSGSILQRGSGTAILSASNTYTGGTTVSSGTLDVLNPGALPCGGLIVGAGGTTVVFNATATSSSPAIGENLALFTPDGSTTSSSAGAFSTNYDISTPTVGGAILQPGSLPVPEPATLALLLAAGGGGLTWCVQRRGSRSKPRGASVEMTFVTNDSRLP